MPVAAQTSFGEAQISETGRSVSERVMKIVTSDELAIGLCGDFACAREIAAFIFASFRRSRDLGAALQEAKISHEPFSIKREARLVIAHKCEPRPRLFAFNHDGHGTVREVLDGEGVPLGSARSIHKQMTHELLTKLFPLESYGSDVYLAAAMGVLQSFGQHDNLLNDGVGGAFTGLCVSRDAIRWQPDLLYVIDEPDTPIAQSVATSVRDGGLVVSSAITRGTSVFSTILSSPEEEAQWINRWGVFVASHFKSRAFDFVVMLSPKYRVVVVIEMKRELASCMFRIRSAATGEKSPCWFEANSEVTSALRRGFDTKPQWDEVDFRIGYLPFEPVTMEARPCCRSQSS